MPTTEVNTCFRYSWIFFPGASITNVMKSNPWIFNFSYNFFTYLKPDDEISEVVADDETVWVNDFFLLFAGYITDQKKFLKHVDWDKYGAWFSFQYPAELSADSPLYLGRDSYLTFQTRKDLPDYFDMSPEWEFIHRIQPDIFLTRTKNGVIAGALNEPALWNIDMTPKIKIRTKK
jgi:hypothetical protein